MDRIQRKFLYCQSHILNKVILIPLNTLKLELHRPSHIFEAI
jgi:hypothetical protein